MRRANYTRLWSAASDAARSGCSPTISARRYSCKREWAGTIGVTNFTGALFVAAHSQTTCSRQSLGETDDVADALHNACQTLDSLVLHAVADHCVGVGVSGLLVDEVAAVRGEVHGLRLPIENHAVAKWLAAYLACGRHMLNTTCQTRLVKQIHAVAEDSAEMDCQRHSPPFHKLSDVLCFEREK